MTAMREHDETPGIGQGMVYWLISPEDQRRTLGTDVPLVYAEHPAGSRDDLAIAVSADCQVPPLSTPDLPGHVRLLPVLGAHARGHRV